jgi:c-di-GMP-related signal transduction protein
MSASGASPASKPSYCIARQPILNKDEKVIGYELFYRESYDDIHFSSDFETATRNTVDTLVVMGLDVVCDGRLGFVNCTTNAVERILPAASGRPSGGRDPAGGDSG